MIMSSSQVEQQILTVMHAGTRQLGSAAFHEPTVSRARTMGTGAEMPTLSPQSFGATSCSAVELTQQEAGWSLSPMLKGCTRGG